MARWKDRSSPANVLRELDAYLESARKDFSIINVHYERAEIIDGLLELSEEIPRLYRAQLVARALTDTQSRKNDANAVLVAVSKREVEYLSQPVRKFHLITDLSVAPTISVPKATLRGVQIASRASVLSLARTVRSKVFAEKRFALRCDRPLGYTEIAATVLARTDCEAAEKALDAIDLWRACLNLGINQRSNWRQSMAATQPINQIVLGPFHTVHLPSGDQASDTFWFDPNYGPVQPALASAERFDTAVRWTKSVRAKVNRCSLMSEIEVALLRYCRALDDSSMNEAFLRLWSLLEHLTGRPTNYEVAIRRAAFVFRRRAMTEIPLKHLRDQRNAFIHASSDLSRPEMLVYMLKRYVEGLLRFLIGSGKMFKNMGEVGALFESPHDVAVIDERIGHLRLARRLLRN